MKKLLLFGLLTGFSLFAQVGVNTTTPNALLDITSSNQAAPLNTDGILIPKIDVFPTPTPTALQQGMLVYLTTTVGTNPPGFYYWNNPTLTWIGIVGSSTSNSLDLAYDFGGVGLGRTITADAGAVFINGTDGLISTGILNSGVIAPTGTGIKMFWNPRKGAFRAGYTVGTQWEDANIGLYSVAFGNQTIASGDYSTAFGLEAVASGVLATAFGETTTASGLESTAFGFGSEASGETATAFGGGTEASGNVSTAFGDRTTAIGNASTAFGHRNTAPSFGETVLGFGATTYTPSANGATQFRGANGTDRLLVVGNAIDANNNNGADTAERHNALTILKNGNTGLGTDTPAEILHIVGKIRIVDGTQGIGKVLSSDANGAASWVINSSTPVVAWELSGNTIVDTTSFIGTKNDVDVIFKRNGFRAGRIGTNNLSYGWHALNPITTGINNSAFGNYALNSNTTGAYNTASGHNALYSNTTGEYNTANGFEALSSITTRSFLTATGAFALSNNTIGYSNTANGYATLNANTTGYRNTANGSEALSNNTTGNYNTASGAFALNDNSTGSVNTATGDFALFSNTTGNGNSAHGNSALASNTTGRSNTASGTNALFSNTTGQDNTALGLQAFYNGDTFSNSTAIGFNSDITASNQVRIGNTFVTSIGGFQVWSNLSDERFKDETPQQIPGLAFIKKLRPVTYYFNVDKYNAFNKKPDSLVSKNSEISKHYLQSGFMAQEVEKAAKELGFDFNGVDEPKNENDHYSLRYALFVVPLVKAVQELEKQLEDKTAEIKVLKTELQTQTQLLIDLLKRVETLENKN